MARRLWWQMSLFEKLVPVFSARRAPRRNQTLALKMEPLEGRIVLSFLGNAIGSIGDWWEERTSHAPKSPSDAWGKIQGGIQYYQQAAPNHLTQMALKSHLLDVQASPYSPSFPFTGGSSAPVYYVNGMSTSRNGAGNEAQQLADHLVRDVRLIYNPTATQIPLFDNVNQPVPGQILGFPLDLAEAIYDRLYFFPNIQHNPTTKRVNRLIYDAWKSGEQLSIVAHSQGTLIVNAALRTMRSVGLDSWIRDNVRVVMTGVPMTRQEFARNVTITPITNPGDMWTELVGYDIGGAKGIRFTTESRTLHDFRSSYVDKVHVTMLWGTSGVSGLPPDAWESNNSANQARNLGTLRPSDGSAGTKGLNLHTANDVDWFKFEVAEGMLKGKDKVRIVFDPAESEMSLALFRGLQNAQNGTVHRHSNSVENGRQLLLSGLDQGVYYLRIASTNSRAGYYRLDYEISPEFAQDGAEPNKDSSEARRLAVGAKQNAPVDVTYNLNLHNESDEDWFFVDLMEQAPAGSRVSISFTNSFGDLDMKLYRQEADQTLMLLQTSAGVTNSEVLDFAGLEWGRYFVQVYGHANAINSYSIHAQFPAPVSVPPRFLHGKDRGMETLFEGQRIEISFKAVDANGDGIDYRLGPGAPNGMSVHLHSGLLTYEPVPGQADQTFNIEVIAEDWQGYSSKSRMRFQVVAGSPMIGDFVASPETITDSGFDLVTLTAADITTPFGQIDFVEFWRDTDGDGVLKETVDLRIGRDTDGSDGWTYSGPAGTVTAGTTTFFARSGRYSFSNTYLSIPESTTVLVEASPPLAPLALPFGSDEVVTSTVSATHTPLKMVSDAEGNYRVFYWKTPENRFYSRRYSADGTALSGPQQLSVVMDNSPWRPFDVTMMPDGSFAVAYLQADSLRASWYAATGAHERTTIVVSSNVSATNPHVQIASDSEGNLLIAYQVGEYLQEDVFAVSVARDGTITRAPWRVNTVPGNFFHASKYPTVALNEDGLGIIAWMVNESPNENPLRVRVVSQYGVVSGTEIEISSGLFTEFHSLYSDVNASGEMVLAYVTGWIPGGGHTQEAQRFDRNGQPMGAPFPTLGGRLALNDRGWIVSTGTLPFDSDGSRTVFAQLYAPSGAAVGPRITVPATTGGIQQDGGVIIDAHSDFIVAWGHDLHAQTWPNSYPQMRTRRFAVNLTPEFVALSEFSIAENSSAGTVIGSVTAIDPDPGSVLTYALMGDSPFTIDPTTGELRVGSTAILDFEQTSHFMITVKVSDNQSPPLSQVTTGIVRLVDMDEPPVILPAPLSVPIGSPLGAFVGTVVAYDPENGPIKYSLLGTSPFTMDELTGVVSVASPAELESGDRLQYQLTVAARDGNANQGTALITIDLTLGATGPSLPPTISGMPTHVPYRIGDPWVSIAPFATISDDDNASFANGLLRVQIADASADDEWGLISDDGVTVFGADVWIEGVLIGELTQAHWAGAPLEVLFNANATPARVTALMRGVRFQSSNGAGTDRTITITLHDGQGGQGEASLALQGRSRWQNPNNPLDVSHDGIVSPIDALLVINTFNQEGSGRLEDIMPGAEPPPYLDVNGDGLVSPIDALLVINQLSSPGNGEGASSLVTYHAPLAIASVDKLTRPTSFDEWESIHARDEIFRRMVFH